jgi:hypothetical protein
MKKLTLSILTIAILFQAPAFARESCAEKIKDETINIASDSVNAFCIDRTAIILIDPIHNKHGQINFTCRLGEDSNAEANIPALVEFEISDFNNCKISNPLSVKLKPDATNSDHP